jgi:hypothetical protein
LGPAGAIGYLGEKFLVGIFPRQWWSVGGARSNPINQLNLQYFASYFFGDGNSVSISPNMLVNWHAPKGQNELTLPDSSIFVARHAS